MSVLSRRQNRLYTYRFNLYRPNASVHSTDLEATDAQTAYTPAFSDVPGYYKSTPELDNNSIAGRSPGVNLFVLDEFHFSSDQEIADTWVIEMTGSDPNATPHPYIGRFWICLDNSQEAASQGRRQNGFQMIYGIISNVQGLSTTVAGLP